MDSTLFTVYTQVYYTNKLYIWSVGSSSNSALQKFPFTWWFAERKPYVRRGISPLYWSSSVFTHLSTGSKMHWLASVLSDFYWLTSILIRFCIGSICTGSTPCWLNSVISGLLTDSLLYWLNSVMAHFYSGSPHVLADFWNGLSLYWLNTVPLPAHVTCP